MNKKYIMAKGSPVLNNDLEFPICIDDIELATPSKAFPVHRKVYDLHLGSGKCAKVYEEDYNRLIQYLKPHFI